MKMTVPRLCIASVTYESNDVAAFDSLALGDVVSISSEVAIKIDILSRGVSLIKRYSTFCALMELQYFPVIGCNDRRVPWGHDVQRFVNTAFGTRIVKRIVQLC